MISESRAMCVVSACPAPRPRRPPPSRPRRPRRPQRQVPRRSRTSSATPLLQRVGTLAPSCSRCEGVRRLKAATLGTRASERARGNLHRGASDSSRHTSKAAKAPFPHSNVLRPRACCPSCLPAAARPDPALASKAQAVYPVAPRAQPPPGTAPFAFNTPSPDDRVLAAQQGRPAGAGGGRCQR